MAEVETNPYAFPDYRFENGKLYRHLLHMSDSFELELSDPWKKCVHKDERSVILTTYHNNFTAAHLGIAKTTASIAVKYFWSGIFRDIATYVRKCESCQKYKFSQLAPTGKM